MLWRAEHTSASTRRSAGFMKRNIDAWWPHIEAARSHRQHRFRLRRGGKRLRHLPARRPGLWRQSGTRERAGARHQRSAGGERLVEVRNPFDDAYRIPRAVHTATWAALIRNSRSHFATARFTLTPIRDAHLCCGSAGTYSLLQAELSQRLLADKLSALHNGHRRSSPLPTSAVSCSWRRRRRYR